MSCSARCMTRHWLNLHWALVPHLLCCSLHTGLPLTLRKLDSCFGRFAEQSPLTGYEPNAPVEVSWRGHRYYLCCIGDKWKIGPGNVGFTTVLTGERQTSANPFGIYQSNRESSETSFSHFSFRLGETPWRDVQTKRKLSRDSSVVQDSQTEREREKKLVLSDQVRACRAVRGERVAQTKLSEAEYHTEEASWGNKKIIYCLKRNLSWTSKNWGRKCRQSSSRIRSAALLSQDGTLAGESVLWSFKREKRTCNAHHWTEEK